MTTRLKEAFDLESVYDSEIRPLMTQIIEICKTHKMPMIASFLYAADPEADDDLSFCTTLMDGGGRYLPEKFDEAYNALTPARRPPTLYITTHHADGSKTITAVIG